MNTDVWCGISASNAGAVIGCPARLALPQVRETGEAAERGNALHAFARVVAKNPDARAQALLDIPEEYRTTAAGMNVELALEGIDNRRYEMAYALDAKTRTARFIGENIGRDYAGTLERNGQRPLSRYEIPFTIDVVGVINGVPVELDYKSGQSIGDPEKHWQRRVCATGLMCYFDTPTAISRVAYIWADGSIHPDGHEFNALDADDYCDELVKAIDAVWAARALLATQVMPTLSPSDDNCKYCPAMLSCPVYLNVAKAMLGRVVEIEKGPDLTTLSEAELFKVWTDLKQAESIVDAQLKRMKTLAAEKPFGDETYEIAPAMKAKTGFDAGAARGLIVQLLGREGLSEEEIASRLAKLTYKTEYPEYRKRKRQLPMAS